MPDRRSMVLPRREPLPRSPAVASSLLGLFLCVAGCSSGSQPRAVSPSGETLAEDHPAGDKDVVVQQLRHGRVSSHHFVTLNGAEEPHVHDRSDLTVFILRGSVRMHFEDREVDVGPGDVVDVPMGAFHWAENIDDRPSLAYVVYSPAFDGRDRRAVKPRAKMVPRMVNPSSGR